MLRVRDEAHLAARLHLLLAFSPLAGLACVGLARRLGVLAPPPRARVAGRTALLAALAGGACALAGSVAIAALQERLGAAISEQRGVVDAVHSGSPRVALMLGIVLFVPIGEELVFRRLGFAALLARHGRLAAYAWSVGVFALVHLNPSGFASYAWVGLVTAVAYERTGRIEVPIAVHAIHNAVAALGMWSGDMMP